MMVAEETKLYGVRTESEALIALLGTDAYSLAELMSGNHAGLKPEERIKVEALVTLIKHQKAAESMPDRITSPRAAGSYLLARCAGWTEERFGILALNAKGDLIADRIISQGTATATMVSPREVFREGLRLGATTILVYHNHPSGDPTPSREDDVLTNRLRSAGETMGIPLADHLVLGGDRYHSYRASQGWDRI